MTAFMNQEKINQAARSIIDDLATLQTTAFGGGSENQAETRKSLHSIQRQARSLLVVDGYGQECLATFKGLQKKLEKGERLDCLSIEDAKDMLKTLDHVQFHLREFILPKLAS